MTGQLRSTLHNHADDLGLLDLDLDAIAREGDRRTRRRRVSVIGGVSIAAVAAVGVTLVTGGHPHSSPAQVTDLGAGAFTYAVGSVVHIGASQVDVGHQVGSLVQTTSGVVFADDQRHVYDVDGDATRAIGEVTGTDSALTVDDAGTTVAWVDGGNLEVYRVGPTDPTTVPVPAPPQHSSVAVKAVTGDAVWFWNGQDLMTYDVSSGTTAQVGGTFASDTLQDVSAGRMLVNVPQGNGSNVMEVVPVGGAPHGQGAVDNISDGDLSPDGRHWFTQDADQFAVFDSATGTRQDPPYDGFAFAAPYKWIDDDTIAALALPSVTDADTAPITLLTCHVSTNACSVTARDIGDFSQVAAPVGIDTRGR
jgi:hypothetical protein